MHVSLPHCYLALVSSLCLPYLQKQREPYNYILWLISTADPRYHLPGSVYLSHRLKTMKTNWEKKGDTNYLAHN